MTMIWTILIMGRVVSICIKKKEELCRRAYCITYFYPTDFYSSTYISTSSTEKKVKINITYVFLYTNDTLHSFAIILVEINNIIHYLICIPLSLFTRTNLVQPAVNCRRRRRIWRSKKCVNTCHQFQSCYYQNSIKT